MESLFGITGMVNDYCRVRHPVVAEYWILRQAWRACVESLIWGDSYSGYFSDFIRDHSCFHSRCRRKCWKIYVLGNYAPQVASMLL